jgi:hypothetical protein
MTGTFGDTKSYLGQSSLPKPIFSPSPAESTCSSPLSSGLPPVAPIGASGSHVTTPVVKYADGEPSMPSKARGCCAAPEGESHIDSTNDRYCDPETRGVQAQISKKATASELRAVPNSRPWRTTPSATPRPLTYSSTVTGAPTTSNHLKSAN